MIGKISKPCANCGEGDDLYIFFVQNISEEVHKN